MARLSAPRCEIGPMNFLRFPLLFGLFLLCSTIARSQTNPAQQPASPAQEPDRPQLFERRPPATDHSAGLNETPQQIELTVPRGTAIRIALSRRVRIGREGAPVEGRVTDTVYA